jgi:transposase
MQWGRFVLHQDLQTLLRCHAAAFEALGGVPGEILYDRMRTVFHREDAADGHIIYNAALRAFAEHYHYQPKACRPYRAQTKGKVERPFQFAAEAAAMEVSDLLDIAQPGRRQTLLLALLRQARMVLQQSRSIRVAQLLRKAGE